MDTTRRLLLAGLSASSAGMINAVLTTSAGRALSTAITPTASDDSVTYVAENLFTSPLDLANRSVVSWQGDAIARSAQHITVANGGGAKQMFQYRDSNIAVGAATTAAVKITRTPGSGTGNLGLFAYFGDGAGQNLKSHVSNIVDGQPYIVVLPFIRPKTENAIIGWDLTAGGGDFAVSELVLCGGIIEHPVPADLASTLKIGTFSGYNYGRVQEWNTFIGKPADFLEIHGDKNSWAGMNSSIGAQLNSKLKESVTSEVRVSIALFPNQFSFSDLNGGAHDQDIRDIYDTIGYFLGDPIQRKQNFVVVRPGREFNGNWYPWKISYDNAITDSYLATQYALGYQRHVILARQVAVDRGLPVDFFRFDWNMNHGSPNPTAAYPGDSYVDLISMDLYYFPQYGDSADGVAAFAAKVNNAGGLNWIKTFANSHGKPFGFPEFGVDKDTSSLADGYVTAFFKWMRDNGASYAAWWNDDGDYASRISNGALPLIGAAVRQAVNPS